MKSANKIDWSSIYESQSGKLLAICRRYVKDEQLAEDLLHDAFIKAINNQQKFNGTGALEGWLRQVVINTVLEHLRTDKKYSFSDIEEVNQTQFYEEPLNNDNADLKSIIDETFSQTELLEVIDELPPNYKTVFNLYVVDGFRHNEISSVLNITVANSKSQLLRARKRIQELLIEKVSMRNDSKHMKKAALSLSAMGLAANANAIDQLFVRSFTDFTLPTPKLSMQLQQVISQANPVIIKSSMGFFGGSNAVIWGSSAVGTVIIGGAIAFNCMNTENTSSPTQSTPVVIENVVTDTTSQVVEPKATNSSDEISNTTQTNAQAKVANEKGKLETSNTQQATSNHNTTKNGSSATTVSASKDSVANNKKKSKVVVNKKVEIDIDEID